MTKKIFKEDFLTLISNDVEGMELSERITFAKEILLSIEKEIEYDEQNKGKEWTDEELRVVLSFSPSKENCLKLAKAFKRGYGSIEQIFRWASTSDKAIEDKGRKQDKFINQVKRVAKEVGWRA
ncbi:hypothetical protein C3943_26795 [Lysinibacillus sp. B2A1]|nr:hypothetical protein C3943_26795 [Lysinibacillus sp. B2A1]